MATREKTEIRIVSDVLAEVAKSRHDVPASGELRQVFHQELAMLGWSIVCGRGGPTYRRDHLVKIAALAIRLATDRGEPAT